MRVESIIFSVLNWLGNVIWVCSITFLSRLFVLRIYQQAFFNELQDWISYVRERSLSSQTGGWERIWLDRLKNMYFRPPLQIVRCGEGLLGFHSTYRIVWNFWGRKLSRNKIFAGKTFADCSLMSPPKDVMPSISWRKLAQIATKPRNSWKFSSPKLFHYMLWGMQLSQADATCSCIRCPY